MLRCTVMLISIPYGSIKRSPAAIKQQLQDAFQFLMVRLKAAKIGSSGYYAQIFQFLMVRLKEETKTLMLDVASNFNSLWFD